MLETIAILGANGVYARHLIPRLRQAGYEVRAIVRRPETAGVARACGCEIRVADVFDGEALTKALAGCTIGVNLATSLPGPSGRGDFDRNDVLRAEGTSQWVRSCAQAGVRRVIQQSIGMVSASGDSSWSDENAVFQSTEDTTASRAIAACLTMEETIRSSGLEWMILRGGLFYGPGTGFDDAWHARAQAGKLRLPGDGLDYVSLVHIADMAAATVAATRAFPAGSVLIVCDDEPCQWRDMFNYITAMAGQTSPRPGGQMGFPSFRLSNKRCRETLGWSPFYPNYRSGLAR